MRTGPVGVTQWDKSAEERQLSGLSVNFIFQPLSPCSLPPPTPGETELLCWNVKSTSAPHLTARRATWRTPQPTCVSSCLSPVLSWRSSSSSSLARWCSTTMRQMRRSGTTRHTATTRTTSTFATRVSLASGSEVTVCTRSWNKAFKTSIVSMLFTLVEVSYRNQTKLQIPWCSGALLDA